MSLKNIFVRRSIEWQNGAPATSKAVVILEVDFLQKTESVSLHITTVSSCGHGEIEGKNVSKRPFRQVRSDAIVIMVNFHVEIHAAFRWFPGLNGDRAKQAWERRKRCRKHVGNLSVKPCRYQADAGKPNPLPEASLAQRWGNPRGEA
jgi:hypothetical protein